MTKVFIRNRQIDNNRGLPLVIGSGTAIYQGSEYATTRDAVNLTSGMEKEEEKEHHLQAVLTSDSVKAASHIPIPGVTVVTGVKDSNEFKLTKNYVRSKAISLEENVSAGYDMDEEDFCWLRDADINITPSKFEFLIDKLDRSGSNKAMTLDEAKGILRDEDHEIVTMVYDYWLYKRVNTCKPLALIVKSEKYEKSSSTSDHYVAFRKRSEKMTTRRNRKVDETSFEKMLKLQQKLEQLREILGCLAVREEKKKSIVQCDKAIHQLCFSLKDFDYALLKCSESIADKNLSHSGSRNDASNTSTTTIEQDNPLKRKCPFARPLPSLAESLRSDISVESLPTEPFKFERLKFVNYMPSRLRAVSVGKTSVECPCDQASAKRRFRVRRLSCLHLERDSVRNSGNYSKDTMSCSVCNDLRKYQTVSNTFVSTSLYKAWLQHASLLNLSRRRFLCSEALPTQSRCASDKKKSSHALSSHYCTKISHGVGSLSNNTSNSHCQSLICSSEMNGLGKPLKGSNIHKSFNNCSIQLKTEQVKNVLPSSIRRNVGTPSLSINGSSNLIKLNGVTNLVRRSSFTSPPCKMVQPLISSHWRDVSSVLLSDCSDVT